MKKTMISFCIAVLLFNCGMLFSQEETIPATMDLLFNRIQVQCKSGQSHIGLLAGIMDRGLVLRREKQDKIIPYRELKHVVIEGNKSGGAYIPAGMILGLYLGNIAAHRTQDTPPFHMERVGALGLILWNTVFAAAGGGLGYMIGTLVEKEKKEFDFTGEEKKRLKQWERLQNFVTGIERNKPKKIHLTVQGGYISTWNVDHYRALLEKSGYYVSEFIQASSGDMKVATKFSLLRKVQLTFSPNSKSEFGLAMCFLSEPSISGSNYKKNPSRYSVQSIDIKSYFAVAAYHPFSSRKLGTFDWSIGVGLGMADFNFDFFTSPHWYTQSDSSLERIDDFHLSKKLLSGVVFTELKVDIQKGLSLGIMADYVYIPKVGIPEFRGAEIPARNLNLGNASFGFLAGFHF